MTPQISLLAAFGIPTLLLLAGHFNSVWMSFGFERPWGFPEVEARALASGLLSSLASYGSAALAAAGAWRAGRGVLAWVSRSGAGCGGWPLEFGAGIIAISVLLAGLGHSGLLFGWVVLPVLLALAAAGLVALAGGVARFRSPSREALVHAVWLVPLLPWLAAAPLLPATNVDILEYHAGLPALWCMNHKYYALPGNLYFAFPLGIERFFIPARLAGLDGGFVSFCVLVLASAATALAGALRACGSGASALGGWMLFLGAPTLFMAWDGHPDTGLVLAASLAVGALARGSVLGMGVACGLAVLCKTLGGTLAVSFLAAFALGRRDLRGGTRAFAVAAFIALVPNLFWMAQNTLLFQNPLYPFGAKWIPSLRWTDCDTQGLWLTMRFFEAEPVKGAAGYAAAFWLAVKDAWSTPYAPLFYMAIPLAFTRAAGRVGRLLALQTVAWGAIWLLPTPKLERFLIPGTASWLAMYLLAGGPFLRGRLRHLPVVFLALGAWMAMGRMHDRRVPPEGVLTGGATAGEYSRATLGEFRDCIDWLNGRGDGRSRVVTVGEGDAYGSRMRWLSINAAMLPAIRLALGEAPDIVRMRVTLRQAGVRWVLYSPVRARFMGVQSQCHPMPPSWLRAYAELCRRDFVLARPPARYDWTGTCCVYEVRREGNAGRREYPWLPGAERLMLSEEHLRLGMLDRERYALQVETARDFGFSLYQQALVAFYVGKAGGRALELMARALERGFRTPDLFNSAGFVHYTRGEYGKALESYEKTLELEPENGTALANIKAMRLLMAREGARP